MTSEHTSISISTPSEAWQRGSPPAFGDAVAGVSNVLRDQIVSGTLAAGAQLKQQRIAQDLGVSHIPVREALKVLEAEGFVVCHPRRGAFVADLTVENALEIWDLRAHLEPLAVRSSVPKIGKAELQEAEGIMRVAAQTSDHVMWMRLNWDLHRTLYSAAKRPLLIEHIESLWNNVDRYCTLLTRTNNQRHLGSNHAALIKAYQAGDIKGATQIVGSHMKQVEERVLTLLRNR